MLEEIGKLIEQIESRNGIQILFVCESGCHAWGFPSTDSGYSLKFIYRHKAEWYISINEQNDELDLPAHDAIEFEGWDIRRALGELKLSNSRLLEWVRSPMIFRNNHAFLADLFNLCVDAYSPKKTIDQYLAYANTHHYRLKEKEDISLKDYFNAIRPGLAALWIAQTKGLPPVEIHRLLPAVRQEQLQLKLLALVDLKKTNPEAKLHKHDTELDELVERSIEESEGRAQSLPDTNIDYARLNAFLRKVLKDAYQ